MAAFGIRRPLPDARRCRRSSTIPTRRTAAAARCARAAVRARRRTRALVERASAICARARSSSRCARWRRTPRGRCARSPTDARTEPGWALARIGDGGWWPAIERGLRAERSTPTWSSRPGRRRARRRRAAGVGHRLCRRCALGDVARRLAQRCRRASSGPVRRLLARTEARPPQREMANAVQQAANVRGAFARHRRRRPGGPASCSTTAAAPGWTLAMVGGQLRKKGSERVVPLVLATL